MSGEMKLFEDQCHDRMERIVTWYRHMLDTDCTPRAATVWNEADLNPQVSSDEVLSFLANSNSHGRQLAPPCWRRRTPTGELLSIPKLAEEGDELGPHLTCRTADVAARTPLEGSPEVRGRPFGVSTWRLARKP